MQNSFKLLCLISLLMCLCACREEVFQDQPINKESNVTTSSHIIDGYRHIDRGIYVSDSIELDNETLPESFEMAEINSDLIAGQIANHYNITYQLEEVVMDNHPHAQIYFGDSLGLATLFINEDSSISMDLNFGMGDEYSRLLSDLNLTDQVEELSFKSIADIELESHSLLASFTGFSEFKFKTYSITKDEINQIIQSKQEIAMELGKDLPAVPSTDLYYVHAIPVLNEYEILAFEILGRREDWTLFNPGAEIKLIFSETGLQNLYINSLYIPGDSIADSAIKAEHNQEIILERVVDNYRERIDPQVLLIDSIDYMYLTYVPDKTKREKIYKPTWRVIVKTENGGLHDILYFDPITGSEYL